MTETTVAERYARAFYELAEEEGQLGEFSRNLQAACDAFGASSELRQVLTDPVLDQDRQLAVLEALLARLGITGLTQRALTVLGRRRRLSALPEITRRFQALADARGGVLRVRVTSAAPLDEGYFKRLVSEIERATGRKVAVERSVDPSLVAGVVTQIGDNTIDGSLKGRLAAYEDRLLASL